MLYSHSKMSRPASRFFTTYESPCTTCLLPFDLSGVKTSDAYAQIVALPSCTPPHNPVPSQVSAS